MGAKYCGAEIPFQIAPDGYEVFFWECFGNAPLVHELFHHFFVSHTYLVQPESLATAFADPGRRESDSADSQGYNTNAGETRCVPNMPSQSKEPDDSLEILQSMISWPR